MESDLRTQTAEGHTLLDYQPAPEGMSKAKWDQLHIAEWVHMLADWEVISHLTFAWEASLDSARRTYEKFMRKHLPGASYFYALEPNPSRDGFHVHALWASSSQIFRRGVWGVWKASYGRARIEPVRGHRDVADYASKYVTKDGSWYDVKLQGSILWRYQQVLRGLDRSERFNLTLDGAPSALEGAVGI